MPNFPFCKFSPSGNTTLFLLGPINSGARDYCRLALLPEGIPAEQCGVANISTHELEMGGGEFCVNACRAFGALLAMETAPQQQTKEFEFEIRASGSPEPVHLIVKGKAPLWHVEAIFSLHGYQLKKLAPQATLVCLPGISHLLLRDCLPSSSAVPPMANEFRKLYDLESCAASGVVWWNEENAALSILPHVSVPTSGTAMLESACGSASLALALAQREASARKEFIIRQPSGFSLSISFLENDRALLGGEVSLCARGQIYLPELSVA